MSLKSFHIVFVTVTMLMSLLFIILGFFLKPESSDMFTLIGWLGIMGTVVAPIYGIYFWNKFKKINA